MNPVTSPVDRTSTDSQIAVWAEGICKRYRTGFWLNQTLESLKGCSLEVYRGETFGLLGPNGAGKTTLLKILLGIVRPTAGRGSVLGYALGSRQARYRLGYLPETPYFYDYLTGWEFLEFVAGLFEVPVDVRRQRISELLERVGLDRSTARQKPLKQYSKGMLQRLGMAQALIGDPEVVFLDEPMSGLDPMGRYQMRETILGLKAQGKTIFFNSHILTDVENICDRVAILARGELICAGSLSDLLGTENRYRVQGYGGQLELLKEWIPGIRMEASYWQGELVGNLDDFLGSLRLMEAKLISLSLTRPTLEDFFLRKLQEVGIFESR